MKISLIFLILHNNYYVQAQESAQCVQDPLPMSQGGHKVVTQGDHKVVTHFSLITHLSFRVILVCV